MATTGKPFWFENDTNNLEQLKGQSRSLMQVKICARYLQTPLENKQTSDLYPAYFLRVDFYFQEHLQRHSHKAMKWLFLSANRGLQKRSRFLLMTPRPRFNTGQLIHKFPSFSV